MADQSQLTYSPRFTTPLRASPVVATAVTVAQSYDDDVHIMANLLVRFSPRATKTEAHVLYALRRVLAVVMLHCAPQITVVASVEAPEIQQIIYIIYTRSSNARQVL